MVELKYDKVTRVEIGNALGDHVDITNVVSFAERIITIEEGMVTPLTMINDWNPGGVHHSHKYWEMEMVLDTDWLTDDTNATTRWAYTQDVDGAAGKAIDEDGANAAIKWFKVFITEYDGTATTLTYADVDDNVVWCTGETSEFSNEDGVRHQTVTFSFICLQDRVRS